MNPSKSSQLVLIFLVPLFILPSLTVPQPAFLKSRCRDDDGNYTQTSTYKTNLHTLLSTISSKTQIDYGFLNISVGQDMDIVHGIALCRADISMSQCHTCLSESTSRIIQDCPNQKDAVGWYPNCMIWYSNKNIFNGLILPFGYYNKTEKTNKQIYLKTFNHTVGSLLMNLSRQAASGDTRQKFATGDVNVSRSIKIYALVQCTPNLQHYDCLDCLKLVTEQILAYCCYGNQGATAGVPNCNIRYQNYLFYDAVSQLPPVISLPVSPPTPTSPYRGRRAKVSKKTLKLILIPICAFLALLSAAISFVMSRMKSRDKGDGRVENGKEAESSPLVESWQMNFATVKVATDNFSDHNKLGDGAFGTVYKGTLLDGQVIAVKRLSKGSLQGEKEFKNEALVIAKLHHRNLVRFLGFCSDGDERFLVYEYLSNNSLDFFLYDPVKRMCLEWQKRYKIIEGIARGLLYLHEESRLLVVHRDLKPSNVLLDAEMNPKISDFGIARLFGADQTHANTTNIAGTHGYMAPEYVLQGQFSIKSDVFSFGVLVLEIISGQKPNDVTKAENGETFLSLAWKFWTQRNAMKFVDPKLSNFDTSEVLRCINIGLLCVQENATQRPIMSSVVMMLNSSSVSVPVPSRPAFVVNIE